jgi:hypothetical protein
MTISELEARTSREIAAGPIVEADARAERRRPG